MRLSPGAVLLGVLLVTGCGSKAGLLVTVEGSTPRPIASLLAQGRALDGSWMDESVFGPPSGETEIMLPATFGIELTGPNANLDGDVEVCVTARDGVEVDLADGCAVESITAGELTMMVVTLVYETDFCGNGVVEGAEDCDMDDLAGEDCVSLGFSGGGLTCAPTCVFDLAACEGPPTIPVPRLPRNGSYLGSVHVPGSLVPTFAWEESLVGGGASITYELQYAPDDAFPPGTTTTAMTTFPSHQPAGDLSVALTPPVGARYYWRVRACAGAACSDYSPTWYVNVGRSDRDLNGDGYADVVVGAPRNDAVGMDAGRAYVYLGGPAGGDSTPDGTLDGEAADDWFGFSVAWAGDVNGDGFADVVIGASLNDAQSTDAGRAYIYLGSAAGSSSTFDATLDGGAAGGYFGISVGSAGDVNGDGYSDVVIGAELNDDSGTATGRAYVYLGGAGSFDGAPDGTLVGEASEDYFGHSVASAGDVNGDGYSDVIVGAYGNDAAGADAGRAYVYLGSPGSAFEPTPDGTLTGEAADDVFGVTVASAGDVNGDGYTEVIVGADLNDTGGSNAGRAYVYLGGPGGNFDAIADATLTGDALLDSLGVSVSSAGDVNDDGYADLVVGAYLNDAGGIDAGRAYVYLGGPGGIDTVPDGTLTGEAAGDHFGRWVASAGDVNGDGYADLVIGADRSGAPGMDTGRAYVYLGGAGGSFDAASDTTFTGEAAGDWFGVSVAAVWRLPVTGADAPRALARLCDPDA